MIVSVALLPDEGKLRIIKLKGLPDRVLKAPEMKVRIKQGEEMIDATIEMVDGVMVVSPKEVYEPKDGDVVSIFNKSYGVWMTAICREIHNERCSVYCMIDAKDKLSVNLSKVSTSYGIIAATEEEKQKLFDKLAEEGLAWDAERKELVKLKWKPKENERYYYPANYGYGFVLADTCFNANFLNDVKRIESGRYFKDKQECQEFCNRLNEAINSVKP